MNPCEAEAQSNLVVSKKNGRSMSDEVEIISDGEGAVIRGSSSAIEAFLKDHKWLPTPRSISLARLNEGLHTGAEVAQTLTGMVEQSATYLKLTPESSRRLQEAGGLMNTKTKGISHAMLGKTGDQSMKWLQVQDSPLSLVTNPAVLSGIGGLMSQAAQQTEAQELRELLVRIDEKLDDVRRAQKDEVLARMHTAAAEITEAMTIREHGGDPKTLWDKVSKVSGQITNVQEDALAALSALADKVESKEKSGQLRKVAREIEQEVAVQLAILARCFELHDEFRVVELDHVLATAPQNLQGHKAGLEKARLNRRDEVLARTGRLMSQLDRAGEIVNANIVLHSGAAREVVGALNSTGELVSDFHLPLGIELTREKLVAVSWKEAIRDTKQLKAAGREVGVRTLQGGAAVGVAALGTVVMALANKDGKSPEA